MIDLKTMRTLSDAQLAPLARPLLEAAIATQDALDGAEKLANTHHRLLEIASLPVSDATARRLRLEVSGVLRTTPTATTQATSTTQTLTA